MPLKKYPKISIVTPVFNQRKYIEQTILSVLNQNYPNLEYIIIDGGSNDGTVDIIKNYEKHLAFWSSEPDEGMYNALLKGFKRSSGDIMAWLNADDQYNNRTFYIVAEIFSDLPQVEWIIGKPTFLNKEGNCVKISDTQHWSWRKILSENYQWIQQENVFWKRSLWNKSNATFSIDITLAGDFELWCQFFQFAKLYAVQTSFAGFRLHGNQLSIKQMENYKSEVHQVFNKYRKKTMLSFLLKILHRIERLKSKHDFVLWLKINVSYLKKKLEKHPGIIHYNFEQEKWEL